MTVTYVTDGFYTGLSTDTKPTASAGHTFYETDTGDTMVADGFYWWLKQQGPWSNRKTGRAFTATVITTGVGSMGAMTAGTGFGTQNVLIDTTAGRYFPGVTGATSGNKGGVRTATSVAYRQTNPRFRLKFKMVDTTNMRCYLGFTAVQELTGDTPLDAGAHGVIFGFRSTDSNFMLLHNDSTGTATAVDTGVAKDTTIHELKIVADNSVPRYSWSLDGSAYSHLTTNLPTAQNSGTVHMQIETAEAVAKTFWLIQGYLETDS